MADERAVYRELVALRRGQGLQAPDIAGRVGDLLRELCGIPGGASPGQVRTLLIARIEAAVERLPAELALAVRSAYGLPPARLRRFYADRMKDLGIAVERDPRTASRRVDQGLMLLAEALLADAAAGTAGNPAAGEAGPAGTTLVPSVFAPDGWYVRSLRTVVRLHTEPVEVLERRSVVAERNGLDLITVSWSLPSGALRGGTADLAAELLVGGRMEQDEMLSGPTYWSGVIRLPRPLERGEVHEYEVRLTGGDRRLMHPYFVHSPHRRCDSFDLRVKFDVAAPPRRIWRLDGVPFRAVDQYRPELGEQLRADSVGEVGCSFVGLRPGLSYGLQWTDS